MLRKLTPYLFFIALGALFVYGRFICWQFEYLVAQLRGLSTVGGAGNASAAAVWADEQVSGWLTQGEATSKLIMAASFYVMFCILPWLLQQLTHPGVTAWKKADYTDAFNALPTDAERFAVTSRTDLNGAIKAAAAMIAAAIIH